MWGVTGIYVTPVADTVYMKRRVIYTMGHAIMAVFQTISNQSVKVKETKTTSPFLVFVINVSS